MPVGQLPCGDRIRVLREGRGWTQEDLAKRSGVNEKTISKMEMSKRVMLKMLSYVADALDVQCRELIDRRAANEVSALADACEMSPNQSSPDRVRVRLRFEGVFEDLDEAIAFLKQFKASLHAKQPVCEIEVDSGSLLVTLEMSIYDIDRFLYDLCVGVFDRFALTTFSFVDLSSSPSALIPDLPLPATADWSDLPSPPNPLVYPDKYLAWVRLCERLAKHSQPPAATSQFYLFTGFYVHVPSDARPVIRRFLAPVLANSD
jgi:transcriptional regulator with XRE-family HTH domain